MRRTTLSVTLALVGAAALIAVGVAGGAAAKKPKLSATPVFKLRLKPSQEVPPIKGLRADAVGNVTFDLTRDPVSGAITSGEVVFYFNYKFPGSVTITGLHVHQAAKGVNNPSFVVDSGVAFGAPDADGEGNVTVVVAGHQPATRSWSARSSSMCCRPSESTCRMCSSERR